MSENSKQWPHSPSHFFLETGTYMITGSTLHKQHFFTQPNELDLLQETLFELAEKYGFHLQAWALFSNHYHLMLQTSDDPKCLRKFITHLHASSARSLNLLQNQIGRKVWFQYWDTRITFEKSYLARLNYIMQNPVKHKLVKDSNDYPWCSIHWFSTNASEPRKKSIFSFKTDTIQVADDY